ncbi:hypothetical protein Bbelb_306700 [Branchiostoma belcheri]|nr:hypothetical protein Bbelb_306700 [Branchiostoma belcheri]
MGSVKGVDRSKQPTRWTDWQKIVSSVKRLPNIMLPQRLTMLQGLNCEELTLMGLNHKGLERLPFGANSGDLKAVPVDGGGINYLAICREHERAGVSIDPQNRRQSHQSLRQNTLPPSEEPCKCFKTFVAE